MHTIDGETHVVAPACFEARRRVVRRREPGGGGIAQATYAAQSFISTRRRSNRSLRR